MLLSPGTEYQMVTGLYNITELPGNTYQKGCIYLSEGSSSDGVNNCKIIIVVL